MLDIFYIILDRYLRQEYSARFDVIALITKESTTLLNGVSIGFACSISMMPVSETRVVEWFRNHDVGSPANGTSKADDSVPSLDMPSF